MRKASLIQHYTRKITYLYALLLSFAQPGLARQPLSSLHGLGSSPQLHVNDMEPRDGPETSKQVSVLSQFKEPAHGPAQRRGLQQDVQVAELSVVTTAQQLVDAVEQGALHIEIRDHLDLTSVRPRDITDTMRMLNEDVEDASDFGQSIRGNCSTRILPGPLDNSGVAPLREQQTRQCVLLTDVHFMSIYQNLWIDNVYIRHRRTPRTKDSIKFKGLVWCGSENCNLWMTNVTLQGDGRQDPEQGGLAVHGGQLYANGLTVTDFGSHASAVFIASGSTVLLENSYLLHNNISDSYPNSAVVSVNAVNPQFKHMQQQDTILRLKNCTIPGSNAAPHKLAAFNGIPYSKFDVDIFSDTEEQVSYYNESGLGATLSPIKAPASRPGIDAFSPWFVNVTSLEPQEIALEPPFQSASSPEKVIIADSPASFRADRGVENEGTILSVAPSPAPAQVPGPANHDNDVEHVPVIVGGVLASLLLCIVASGIFIVKYKRRKKAAFTEEFSKDHCYGLQHSLPPTCAPRAQISADRSPDQKDINVQDSMQALSMSDESPLPAMGTNSSGSAGQHANNENATSPFYGLFSLPISSPGDEGVPGGATRPRGLPASSTAMSRDHSVGAQNKNNTHRFMQNFRALFSPPPVSEKELEATGVTAPDVDTFDLTRTAAPVMDPPAAHSSLDAKMDFLQQQLDSFGTDQVALKDLVLLGRGHKERLQGGQAVVQMARSKMTGLEYAIKFFASEEAYKVECGMYRRGSGVQDSELAQFLPQVVGMYVNRDEALKDMHGHPLPPCIVMERGESLDLWAERAKPDRPQAFMMINQLAYRLMELHALGYVHRDLKPGNVMWLPRENRWTVIDFGCVARAGTTAKIAFSVAYAAPEVVAAYRRGDQYIVVKEAVDAWSLGVMAFELLTGRSAFRMVEGKEKVMDRIQGLNGLTLPWEASVLTAQDQRKLGVFTPSITALLSRDPCKRPSMEQFCESCNKVLAGTTSVQV